MKFFTLVALTIVAGVVQAAPQALKKVIGKLMHYLQ